MDYSIKTPYAILEFDQQMLRIAALLLTALLTACATGRDFDRPTTTVLVLGVTTLEDTLKELGEPQRRTMFDRVPKNVNDTRPSQFRPDDAERANVTQIFYHRSSTSVSDPRKGLTLYFWQGKLVHHVFSSSFDADTTNFNESRIQEIVLGRSTRADLERLLGPPAGESMYPMISARDLKSVIYVYSAVDSKTRLVSAKVALFLVDDRTIVRDQFIIVEEKPLQVTPGPIYIPRAVYRGKR